MELKVTKTDFGVRPPVAKPHPDFLKFVGEDGIREIVEQHYEAIKDSDIASMFPVEDDEFEQAKKNASDFFIQICGGPTYFNQNRGAPKMIARHMPFRITAKARETWLELYIPIFEKLEEKVPEVLIKSFWDYLDIFSLWMINTRDADFKMPAGMNPHMPKH
jgi:hemoglobin